MAFTWNSGNCRTWLEEISALANVAGEGKLTMSSGETITPPPVTYPNFRAR